MALHVLMWAKYMVLGSVYLRKFILLVLLKRKYSGVSEWLYYKQTASWRKSKDLLARNQDNMSEWDDMSIHEVLFQCALTIKILISMLV
jgi:hypothetical protein